MKRPLHLLLVEDSPDDAGLILAQLKRDGFDPSWTRVETEADFVTEIKKLPDLILCDYSLPQFSGLRAAKILQETGLLIPFILVSGTVGEDAAVEAMRHGATDYLLKDRIARLGSAVERALEQAQLRRQRITDEADLRRTHEALRQMVAHSPVVIYELEVQGQQFLPVRVSENIERMLGYSAAETMTASWWTDCLHPDDLAGAVKGATKGMAAGTHSTQYRIRHKNGIYHWIEDSGKLVQNEPGRPAKIVGALIDITERKRLEEDKSRLEDQFLRAQRLENIGMLAGGIAHDLNNVLAPIIMSCDLLAKEVHEERPRSLLEMIEGSAQRGVDLVKQVLSFARGMEGQRLAVQPQHIIREIVSIARQTFPKTIRVKSHLPRSTWIVMADPTQLHQVLLNLCINARDAMPDGGQLLVSVEDILLDGSTPGGPDGAEPGKYVVIKVKDSGTGIDPVIKSKIFDPFFTTKGQGLGTGLGLSTSLAIVKTHAGFMELESELGTGSTFEIWLPAAAEQHASAPPTDEVHFVRGHGECVLVVDDEAAIRTLTKQTLEAYGYSVLTASNGAEAVAVYARHKDEIEVIITDVIMPIMDGHALIRALMVIKPNVRIIASSGSPNKELQAKVLEAGAKRLIPKPYTVEAIVTNLDDVLRAP